MRDFYFGLDLGHYEVKFSILEEDNTGKFITYNQSLKNEYLKEGEILENESLINLLENLFYNTLESLNINKINSISVCFNFPYLQSYIQKSHSIIENNVKKDDIKKAINTARTSLIINNQEILVEEPLKFILDNNQEIRDPLGFNARRLDVEVLFIGCHKTILNKIRNILYELKIGQINFLPSFYASSKVCLNKKDKEIGVGILDLGSEITTLAIFQYGKLVNYKTFNFGGATLTEDLAMYLKIDIEEAEKLKLDFFNNQLSKDKKKNLKIKKFIEKKIKDYFDKNNLRNYLKDIKNKYRLPAGIVLTGGSARIINLDGLLKNIFDIQIRLPKNDLEIFEKTDDILKYSGSVGCALIEKEINHETKNDWFKKLKDIFTFRY
ncbi:MAG: hypothetical protein KatS3mg095_0137 [Candidatus Parcubacteria bacterium]|nr:MAG: hypothetical protein KatS3mg095_0137 [Candidatus Parcubacteria bacterium]